MEAASVKLEASLYFQPTLSIFSSARLLGRTSAGQSA